MLRLPSERGWFWYGLADPVTSGKYSGAFVFTALVAEPYLVLFTVPLNGFTIARHCNCRDLVLFVGRLPWLCGPTVLRRCLRRDVVWWWRFHCVMVLTILVWDSVWPMTGSYTIYYFQYQEVRWVYLHAELLVQQQ